MRTLSHTSARIGLLLAGAAVLHAQIDVGSGAPTEDLTRRFINAYYRNGFYTLVSLPPIGNVSRFGATGLIQEFRDAARTANVRLALVKANATAPEVAGQVDILHMQADLYGYYATVGVNTAGYPVNDTQQCPPFDGNSCQYQFFDKNYALFAYKAATTNGQNFTVRDPFYTAWVAAEGINGLGRATDAERAATSKVSSSAATVQRFFNGAIYNITSGSFSGRIYAVPEPVYAFYATLNAHDGALGLPIDALRTLPNGRRRQTFEGGAIEYVPGSDPVLRLPVSDVLVTPSSSPVRLELGQTFELRARLLASNGGELTDRTVSWTTSNGRVAAITVGASGATATVRAVGAGAATITASSEGKSSTPIQFVVSAPCCQVGEGAPTPAIQQSFLDAVTRNRLNVQIPAPGPVRRAGAGYVQELLSATQPVVRYLVAKADSQSQAYIVTGDLLARYETLRGPDGVLGHPVSDALAAGRQAFENGTLAGVPLRVVSGAILARWAAGGYESGPLGPPASDAVSLLSSLATLGSSQGFAQGSIFAIASGARTGQAYAVSGLILARYLELNGAEGTFGFPTGEEAAVDGRRRQAFEGGSIEYRPGDTAAVEQPSERKPSISALPDTVPAGSRLRLAVGGFAPGATVRISVTGRADFSIATPNGAYTWEIWVPADAPPGVVPMRAADAERQQLALGQYTVRSQAEARAEVIKLQGDGQTGAPGAQLPQTLRVAVRDLNGNPLAGIAVKFTPSPGASLISASTATDAAGQAEASVRLPASEGITLITAEASRAVTTFSVRSAAFQTSAFPAFRQTSTEAIGNGSATIQQKGALLVAASAILRHHQNRGTLTSAAGPIDASVVNRYLRDFCVAGAAGAAICDGYLSSDASGDRIANLWRLSGLVNGQLDVRPLAPSAEAIRDRVVKGAPVLLVLRLTADGAAFGGHYVVATGIEANGSLRIHDPHPLFARSTLAEYAAGFGAGGKLWRGTLTGALALDPVAAPATGFLLSSISQPPDALPAVNVFSAGGACGAAVDLPDAGAFTLTPGSNPLAAPASAVSRFRYCEGTAPAYQVEAGPGPVIVTDLAPRGGRFTATTGTAVSLGAGRVSGLLSVAPLTTSIAAGAILNAADYEPAIAPGSLISIFGAGLAASGQTAVDVAGIPATVVFASPFQLNVAVPLDAPVGSAILTVRSAYGSASQPIEIRLSAPAIFDLGSGRWSIFNADGTANSASAPASRGGYLTIIATGLGAVAGSEGPSPVVAPVVVRIGDLDLTPDYAGLAPGYPGVYQINLPLPAGMPPGLDLPLTIVQSGAQSGARKVSLR